MRLASPRPNFQKRCYVPNIRDYILNVQHLQVCAKVMFCFMDKANRIYNKKIKEYLKIRKLIHSKLHFLPIVKHYTLQLFLAKNLSINIDIDFFVQGLIFLVVFGFILVLQFVCMLIHRFTTLCHFIARAPYRCGQEYRTSISLMSPLSSEERAVQRLLPEVRRLMQNQ